MIKLFTTVFFAAALIAPNAIAATSSTGKVTPASGCKWVGRVIICPDDKPKQSIALLDFDSIDEVKVPGRTNPKRRIVVAAKDQKTEKPGHRASGR